ncbi:MAG: hypothetical protein KJ990_03245 [Proteobacteria bacterium]|nr:hypothetical protein [Pseudomonadota bacterium]MBU1649538.1 hypothetical protein [Pseudomonadota bacterium]MBU1986870.1 hypothetical protein [Pseudomonadota bacterium]
MKKILSTVAALGLVAGIATSASALELKVKGDYTVDGFYISDGLGAAAINGEGGQGLMLVDAPGFDAKSDAWLQHMFNIEAEMVVNDKVSMMSRVRLVDWGTVWGSQDDTDVNNARNMSVERLWMVYKSPIGVWEIGRRPAGAWGLSFVDKATAGDRIMWKSGKLMGEEFSMYAFYQKMTELDGYLAETDNMDKDYYEVAGSLKGGWGNASLAYGLSLDNTTNTEDFVPNTGFDTTVNRIKGVAQIKIGGSMGFDTEFDYLFGDKDYNSNSLTDADISKFAFIADLNGTMDALTGHAMYFHISGDDNGERDGDLESYGGTGSDFEPLYILTGVFGNILNQDQGASFFGSPARTAGANGFVLTADFAATQDLTLHAGFGYAEADKEMAGWDNDYGFEYNVGAAYKLLDNLTYAVHLGYFDTGDFFKMGTTVETNEIFLASHHLTMSF